ncbi:MAG: tetratricopeptide repeat protein, partial [Bacteroidota bacterium]
LEQRLYRKSIEFQEKSLAINQAMGVDEGVSANYVNLGQVYLQLKEYRKAQEYLEAARKMKQQLKDRRGLARVQNNLGLIYTHLGKYAQAERSFREALAGFEVVHDERMQVAMLNNIGFNLVNADRDAEAVPYLKDAYAKARGLKALGIVLESSKNLARVYTKLRQPEDGLKMFGIYIHLRDSVENAELSEQLVQLEADIEAEKRQQETDLLAAQNEENELALARRQTMVRLLIVIVLAVALIAAIFFIRARLRQKANVQLEALNALKSRFFANISHEFRTPLTLITAPLEALEAEFDPDDPRLEKLRYAQRNAQQLHLLNEQLLDLARLEANRLELRAVDLDFAAHVRQIAEGFHALAQHEGIHFHTEIP